MATESAVPALLQHWLSTPPTDKERAREALVYAINHLIQTDFAAVVRLLYTVDVSEGLVKTTLRNAPTTDAATLLTNLLLERLSTKAIVRKNATPPPPPADDELAW